MNTFYIENTKFKVNTKVSNTLEIKSHPNNYKVYFDIFKNNFTDKDVVLIDKNVHHLYNISHNKIIIIEATELNKSIDTVLDVCEKLTNFGFDKGYTLNVIGGGIIQDIGAFTAKIYKRGINWIFYPTTLLSQCDSCIGGKTALNFRKHKNQLALFSAPQKVIIDTNFLKTLKKEDITSGYGEIIKLFLMGGEYYTSKLDEFDIDTAVFHALTLKKAVVDYDEFEILERKSLNYGHSFGHIIEPMTNYKIPHGEAVLLGILIINKLFDNLDYVSDLIEKWTSLDKIKNIDVEELVKRLKTDKKVSNGIISFVTLPSLGKISFMNQKIDNNLINKVHEIFTN